MADIRPVDLSIGKPSVRCFFGDDRSASERLVAELGRFLEEGTSPAPDHASEGARVSLDLKVVGGRCVYLILEQDSAIDLALRLTGTVMGQRRAATA